MLQRDSLAEKEQALLDLLSRGQCSSTELAESFGLTELKEAPDDIAILVVCRL